MFASVKHLRMAPSFRYFSVLIDTCIGGRVCFYQCTVNMSQETLAMFNLAHSSRESEKKKNPRLMIFTYFQFSGGYAEEGRSREQERQRSRRWGGSCRKWGTGMLLWDERKTGRWREGGCSFHTVKNQGKVTNDSLFIFQDFFFFCDVSIHLQWEMAAFLLSFCFFFF